MTVCVRCSSEVAGGDRFCSSCGAPATVFSEEETRIGAATTSLPGLSDQRFVPGVILAGRYRVAGPLGRGGMGEVYRADDLKLQQPVALKFLPPGLENDPDRLSRFLGEVRIARQIAHPNVCRVYDVGEVDGQHFLSMEFVDGEDLASLLRRIGRLPQDKALQIARQICAGLSAAHDKGILHRDLKPANVMLDARGQVRITDFGLAGLADAFEGAEIRSGTPQYMAPEQLAGEEVTLRSEVYSLGLLLYELFTGRRTFSAGTIAELSRLQREESPTSPSSHLETLDPAVERIILRCLEKRPDDRPGSVVAVAAALPGGDPLAAAIAAGETPSPELVAAAGPTGALRVPTAAALLAVALLGMLLLAWRVPSWTLLANVPLDRPLASLADDARRTLARLGYAEPFADTSVWLEPDNRALAWLADQDATASRWEPLRDDRQLVLTARWRGSTLPMAPRNFAHAVRFTDPYPSPGDARVELDVEGRLKLLLVTPAAIDPDLGPPVEADWDALFDEADLVRSDFADAEPRMLPQVSADTRRAWTGSLPDGPSTPVRVEAASLNGKPVYFEVLGPWHPGASDGDGGSAAEAGSSSTVALVAGGLMAIVAIGGLLLAIHHYRRGRGDRRGAFRLALFLFGARMLFWILTGHHVPSVSAELLLLGHALGASLIVALIAWALYMALEPHLRRLYPKTLVSWSRLMAGRFTDPIVGRDVLIGFAAGAVLLCANDLAFALARLLDVAAGTPVPWGIGAIAGARHMLGQFALLTMASLNPPLGYFVLFLIIALVLRRRLPTQIVFVAIFAIVGALQLLGQLGGAPDPRLLAGGIGIGTGTAVLLLLLMTRAGLFATAACFFFANSFAVFPFTLDPSRPWFGSSFAALAAITALAALAFRIATAGPAAHAIGDGAAL